MDNLEMVVPVIDNIGFKPWYRYNHGGKRLYTFDGDKLYYSVTTIIRATTPTSYALQELMLSLGKYEYKAMMHDKANYGTLFHILCGKYLKDGYYEFNNLMDDVREYCLSHFITIDISHWIDKLKKDLVSFAAFVNEHNVKPLAVEVPACYDSSLGNYAGAIDIVCSMENDVKGFYGEVYKSGPRKGEPKESVERKSFNAIIDIKSGGVYPEHAIQLAFYRKAWNQMMNSMGRSDLIIDKVFNWSPKDWRSEPSFSLIDQSPKNMAEEFEMDRRVDLMLELFYMDNEVPDKRLIINGHMNGNIQEVCRWAPVKDYILGLQKTNV